MNFKHNRKRNSGLVFELLVRRIALQVLNKDVKGFKKTQEIVTKYFSEGTLLAAERDLFETIKSTRNVSRSVAEKILGKIYHHSKKLDPRILEIKKSNLIKEINYTFGKSFFSEHRIPDYRLYASIQMILDGSRMTLDRLNENVQRIQLEDALINFMTSPLQESVENKFPDKDIDGLVCTMAVRKFQKDYGESLSKDQKRLMEQYLVYLAGGNREKFVKFLMPEIKRIQTCMSKSRSLSEIKEDKVMEERYVQAQEMFGQMDDMKDFAKIVEKVMLYQSLCDELER